MIARRFREQFGRDCSVVASAPGRVNLIGEHTDYSEGFVLPVAIDRRVTIAAAPRSDGRIAAFAEHFTDLAVFEVPTRPANRASSGWPDYVAGMAWSLGDAMHARVGADLLIDSTVPIGAGLASSAALELAVARALCAAHALPWDATAMALAARRAENEYVGVPCGIMDQMASAAGQRGHALLLDCRTLGVEPVEMPRDVAVVVMDTGVRRTLSATEYGDRLAACGQAVAALRRVSPAVRSLRDATRELLDAVRDDVDPVAFRRAVHVVAENRRPEALRHALLARDFASAGALMNDSHASLRDLYEVSSPHLDDACDLARAHPACHGARMTGAGFGGCAVALVERAGCDAFIAAVQPRYESRTYKRSAFFAVAADDGARLEPPRRQER